ncbi:MAG: hypothetical protein LCH85_01200 [Chloroflexi bacterium]|nr:hypothetical protein [Chloroflexota bacterium]
MKHLGFLYLLYSLLLFGCQSAIDAIPTLQPTPSIPIDTLYFSETPIETARSIEGIAIVSSAEAFYRSLNQLDIQIIYLDQTSIDQMTNESLRMMYQKSIVIAAFDTPISMLARKAGHPQKIPDLELRKPQAYVSAIYQFNNKVQSVHGEYNDFLYDDFAASHRRIKLQRLLTLCGVGLAQLSQCAEFE